jgi:methyl-accepting chemotaxis protein
MRLPLIGTLKLRGRLTLYVTLLAVVPMVLLNWAGSKTTRTLMREQIHEMLLIEAEGLRDLVEASLVERETSVRSWAEDAALREALLTGHYQRSDEVLARLQLRYTTFTGLVLFSEEGKAVSASTPALRDSFWGQAAAVREAPWFQAAQQGRFTSETLLEEDPVFGMRVLHLAVPVMESGGGRRLGVLLAAYDWGQVGEVVKAARGRAPTRGHESFALEVRTPQEALIFDSRGQEARRIPDAVSVEAVNGPEFRDVGDGWRFRALADPREIYAPVERIKQVVVGVTAGVALLIALVALLLARGITQPVTRLNQAVRHIVQQGDLTQALEVRSTDEVGELARSFSQMVDNLRASARSLQRGTRVLTDTVAELTRTAAQQEQSLTRQASALQQTQVTAEEIKQTSLVAADKASAVLQVATRAEELGRSGEQALQTSMVGFQQLSAQVEEMVERISRLNERTQQIGGITQTVKDLADRSNMLALNAAIEAVRSGEHGKGFSIVAKEIRTLANQSIHSTAQVREILDDITHAILLTVRLSEEGRVQMEAGMQQARASGGSIQALSAIVQDNVGAVRQISTAVSQQNAGIEQITTAVTDLSQMMADTMMELQASQRVTQALREVAAQMEEVAQAYRV